MGVIKLNGNEYSGGSSANIDIATTLTEDTVNDTSVPSSKAVYSIVDNLQTELNNVIDDNNKINNNLSKIFFGNGVSQLQVFLDYPENQCDVFHIRLSDNIGRVHAVRFDQSTIEYAIYFPDTDEWKSIWVK